MKHISEIFNKVRSVFFVMMTGLLLVILVGTSGCSFGDSSGPGNSVQKEDSVGCTDNDGDGFYVEEGCGKRLDCDDRDPTINPQAKEFCVGIDNDCDGLVDEDCLPEVCDDGIDNDGDGINDEACLLGNSFVSDTGQTRCYDTIYFLYPCPSPGEDFYGQDACYATISSPFTRLDAGGFPLTKDALNWAMVRDNLTGLIWEVKTEDGTIHDKNLVSDWDRAGDAFMAQLNDENFGGFSDWRLPTIKELNSIANFIGRSPAINTDFFPNTIDASYWSATMNAADASSAWSLDFDDGGIVKNDKQKNFSVRAVRGIGSSPIYTDNGDGTVTVTENGKHLMWARDSSSEAMTWQDALRYCQDMTLAGYSDWRMPNIKELRSLVDYGRYQQAINENYFPKTSSISYYSNIFWSSTTHAPDASSAWFVHFDSGNSPSGVDKTYMYANALVRPVRGGL